MSSKWSSDMLAATVATLAPNANPDRAAGAFRYMQGIAPFLGISAPDRRRLLSEAWLGLARPSSDQLGKAALALMRQPEREYHYAAYDLVERFQAVADEHFLTTYGAALITTTPWWDSVDGFVSAMVSPLMRRFHNDALMDAWSSSENRWLIRAAIGHQRGWKGDTNVARVLQLCDEHWAAREFFIAKAIGWAMRDIARIEPQAIRAFLNSHDTLNRVAIREAERGLGIRRPLSSENSAS